MRNFQYPQLFEPALDNSITDDVLYVDRPNPLRKKPRQQPTSEPWQSADIGLLNWQFVEDYQPKPIYRFQTHDGTISFEDVPETTEQGWRPILAQAPKHITNPEIAFPYHVAIHQQLETTEQGWRPVLAQAPRHINNPETVGEFRYGIGISVSLDDLTGAGRTRACWTATRTQIKDLTASRTQISNLQGTRTKLDLS